jgi:hypothetical protein
MTLAAVRALKVRPAAARLPELLVAPQIVVRAANLRKLGLCMRG